MPYKWNPKAQRYQWFNGKARFVSREEVMNWIYSSLRATSTVTDTLAKLVKDQIIAPRDWYEMMKQNIKDEYIRQYITGIGGRANMKAADWGRIGAMVKEQYGWLTGFYQQIKDGKLSEAQIAMRARMYINSAREAYEKANAIVAIKWGADEVYWDVDPSVENCTGCIGFQSLGWSKIASNPYGGAYPGSGNTPCLTSCHCTLHYRNSITGEEF